MNKEIILGLDVSTSCLGCCIMNFDEEIKTLTHIIPKINKKIKGMEALFLKKEIFEKEFLELYKNVGITKVIIEEPLLSSNNVNTVATLLRFNGMISDSVYKILNIVPTYISSFDARKYGFPELVSVRKFNKKGEIYEKKKIIKDLKDSHLVPFGAYPWDIDRKGVIWNMVSELYPYIEWLYNKKGELKKENFDMCDALACVKAYINMMRYGDLNIIVTDYKEIDDNTIEYDIEYWGKHIKKRIVLS